MSAEACNSIFILFHNLNSELIISWGFTIRFINEVIIILLAQFPRINLHTVYLESFYKITSIISHCARYFQTRDTVLIYDVFQKLACLKF